jgi:hypothetical protein
MQPLVRNAALLSSLMLVAISAMPVATATSAEAADRLIRECRAEGPGDISMQARFERRDARRKFSVEFEAASGGAFREGQRIVFVVASENVGSRRLETVVGGDLVADLNFDTQAGANDPDEDPFPASFPPIQRGTKVRVKAGGEVVLGCALR